MEALQEAYRQIHAVEDSDERGLRVSSQEDRERISRPVSPSSPPQHAGQSLQPVHTNESGQTLSRCKYTVDSLSPYDSLL